MFLICCSELFDSWNNLDFIFFFKDFEKRKRKKIKWIDLLLRKERLLTRDTLCQTDLDGCKCGCRDFKSPPRPKL